MPWILRDGEQCAKRGIGNAEMGNGRGRAAEIFFVVKVSPDAVTIPERKGWKNRHSASGIVTRLLPALFRFLEWSAPSAKGILRLMEQWIGSGVEKCRLFARALNCN